MSISKDHDGDDPWMVGTGSAGTVPAAESKQPALRIETIEGVEPLDIRMGVFPKKTVPDVLYDALFGQPDPSLAELKAVGGDASAVPPVRTYAILDAAKVMNLPELLENSGLEHRCLFKGDAYDQLKDVAPWIIRLEEDNRFTRDLFTRSDAYWHLWAKEPGVYVRSRAALDDLWRHLRKFTRVPDDQGKMHYLRFWNYHVFLACVIGNDPSKPTIPPILGNGNNVTLRSALALDAETGIAWIISGNADDALQPSRKPFRLKDEDTPLFRRALVRPLAVKLVPQLRKEHGQICVGHNLIDLQLTIERSLMRLHEYGFRRHDILKELIIQDIYLGYPFEDEDMTGNLRRICKSDALQTDRYAQICRRLQDMTKVTNTSSEM